MQRERRSYTSENRQAQAARMRRQILHVAKALFQAEGFDRVTINMLAHAAEVSAPTVYAIFKSKRGVLQSLMDEALPPAEFEALVQRSMQESCPRKCLSTTAKLARQIYDAERDLMDILRSASVVGPEFKELEQEREQRRYDRQEEYAKMLMQAKALAKGITLRKARDILWTLTGRDIYRMCVIECGWTSELYEKWLAGLLIKALLHSEE